MAGVELDKTIEERRIERENKELDEKNKLSSKHTSSVIFKKVEMTPVLFERIPFYFYTQLSFFGNHDFDAVKITFDFGNSSISSMSTFPVKLCDLTEKNVNYQEYLCKNINGEVDFHYYALLSQPTFNYIKVELGKDKRKYIYNYDDFLKKNLKNIKEHENDVFWIIIKVCFSIFFMGLCYLLFEYIAKKLGSNLYF